MTGENPVGYISNQQDAWPVYLWVELSMLARHLVMSSAIVGSRLMQRLEGASFHIISSGERWSLTRLVHTWRWCFQNIHCQRIQVEGAIIATMITHRCLITSLCNLFTQLWMSKVIID